MTPAAPLVLLPLLALPTAPVPTASAEDEVLLEPSFEDLSARWERAREELAVPGLAVVVVEGARVLHLETFGVRDVESGAPVTPETIFYIASATKPFVALAALLLAEEGRLELDAPVRDYLPRFALADPDAAASITVRDLLCHRPGINSFPVVFLDAYTGEITEERYDHFLAQVEPTGEVTYTNVHFTLAGRVLEAVDGRGWREVLAARLFTPAGLDRTTGYADWMYAQEDVAVPSIWNGERVVRAPVRKTDATMHAAGGLGTSIGDLSRWLTLQLDGGVVGGTRLVSREGLETTHAEQSRLARPDARRGLEGFGLGWMRGRRHGQLLLQHGGGYVGSAAHVSFLPELGIGVAVLANTDGGGQAICELVSGDMYERLIGDELAREDPLPGLIERARRGRARGSPRPEGANPAAATDGLSLPPEACVGIYRDPDWGTLEIARDAEGLVGRIGGLRFELLSRGRDRFLAWSQGALEGEGRFELEEGRAKAVTLDVSGNALRFRR